MLTQQHVHLKAHSIRKRADSESAGGNEFKKRVFRITRIDASGTVKPLLRGHPDERPTPLERPLDNVNLNKNVLISNPDKRSPLLIGHISGAKGVESQEGFHCIYCVGNYLYSEKS